MASKLLLFLEHDIDHSASARDHARQLNPRGSVPTIEVDSEVLVGFGPDSLEHAITTAAERRVGG